MTAALRQEGYLVFPVASGNEVLLLLENGLAPDLVLLDMMIPPPDGWQIMGMRSEMPALALVPVIIMTAMGVASPEWAASLGACGLIRKPLKVGHMLTEVRRCIDQCSIQTPQENRAPTQE